MPHLDYGEVFKLKRIRTNSTNPCFILATFRMCFNPFSNFMMRKLSDKYYNKRITICDYGSLKSHDEAKSKLNSNNNANSSAHTITQD